MSVTLAFAFELGLALSLTAILLSDSNSKNILPWALMIILCAVQVIGNVYSTYKYIALSETEYYQYLAQPLLFWIEEISEETVRIIISWIIGAILPIIALFMTDMVASNLKIMHADDKIEDTDENTKDEPDEPAILTTSPSPVKTETESPAIIEDDVINETATKVEEKNGLDLEDVKEEDVDVPAIEKKSSNKIINSVKSLFNKPRPQEIKEEVAKDNTVINQPNIKKSSYNASPSYFKSPESEVHK